MKKFILAVAAVLCIATATQAQETFSKGTKVVNVGIGFGSNLGGTGYNQTIPPIHASLDWSIVDNLFDAKSSIGVGGYLGFAGNKWETSIGNISYGWKYTYIIIGARGTFHYQFAPKFEAYAGLMLGYNIASVSDIGNVSGFKSDSNGGFAFGAFLGARYYITDNIGVFAELGYGMAYFNLGASFKF
jgi:hypothetical protein